MTKEKIAFIQKKEKTLLISGSSPPDVFLAKGVLKICCKFTVEHPC